MLSNNSIFAAISTHVKKSLPARAILGKHLEKPPINKIGNELKNRIYAVCRPRWQRTCYVRDHRLVYYELIFSPKIRMLCDLHLSRSLRSKAWI